MAKLSKRQKFLRESSSSSGKRWQFNKEQLDQIESLYGANVRNIYEPEEAPPQQLSSKRKNFLSMTGGLEGSQIIPETTIQPEAIETPETTQPEVARIIPPPAVILDPDPEPTYTSPPPRSSGGSSGGY